MTDQVTKISQDQPGRTDSRSWKKAIFCAADLDKCHLSRQDQAREHRVNCIVPLRYGSTKLMLLQINHMENWKYNVVLFCFVLCCFVLFCVVLCCFVLFCVVLCCVVLCCFVLFCVVLCCVVLCCVVLAYMVSSSVSWGAAERRSPTTT